MFEYFSLVLSLPVLSNVEDSKREFSFSGDLLDGGVAENSKESPAVCSLRSESLASPGVTTGNDSRLWCETSLLASR